jgi:hypothetical protein
LSIAETDGLGPELRPSVDGHDLLADYRNDRGVDPDRVLPPLSAALLPTQAGASVLVRVCSCGETGCGALGITVRRVADEVLWEPIPDSRVETLKRTYRFGLRQYLDEVDRCAQDRPGEGRGRRVARQVVLLLRGYDDRYDSMNSFYGRRIDWVSAWPWSSSETVKVSLIDGAGEQQVLEFESRPRETEARFAARVAAELGELRRTTR